MLVATLAGCSMLPRPHAGGGSTSGAAPAPALAKTPDEGMTSPTHARFVGQIVFANAQIDKANPDEAALVTELYADEPLYGRVFMPHSIRNHPVYASGSDAPHDNTSGGFFYKLYVDGAIANYQVETGEARDRPTATTRQVWPHPLASDEPTHEGWTQLVAALTPGAHTLRFELWTRQGSFESREPLATGTITLHKAAGTSLAIGTTFADLHAGMTDPALADNLLALARAFIKRASTPDTATAAKIKSAAWNPIRERGSRRVVAREIEAWVRSEWPDGHCTAQAMWFVQPMSLTKPSGPVAFRSVGDAQPIDCVASTTAVADHGAGRTRPHPTPTAAKVAPAPVAKVAPPVHDAAPVTVATAPSSSTSSSTALDAHVTPAHPRAARGGPLSLGVGVAANALDATGVASYANIGLHLGRVEVGAGATWPLDVLGYARFAVLAGRFELAPMISASMLAESKMDRQVAVAAGLSMAYQLTAAPMAIGLRLDALVSYNPDPSTLALPVIGSTYVRF